MVKALGHQFDHASVIRHTRPPAELASSDRREDAPASAGTRLVA